MRNSGEFKIIVGSALFALIPIFVLSGNELSIQGLLFGRLFLAAVVLFILDKKRKDLFRIPISTCIKLILWSLFMLGAMVFYFLAIEFSNMSVSSTLLGTQPLIIIFLAAILLKEKISNLSIIAGLITLVGIFFVSGFSDIFKGNYFLGEFFAIISALLLSLNFVVQKKYLNQFSGKRLVFYQCFFQLPFLFPFLFFHSGKIGVPSLISILVLAIVCTVISYSLIYEGIKSVVAQKIGVLQSVEYVVPILIGFLFYDEKQTSWGITGITLIMIACVFVGFQKNTSINSKV